MNPTLSHIENIAYPVTAAPLGYSAPAEEAANASGRTAGPREEVRNALLDATGDLIQRHGYRRTSVEDIARGAGVSRATAYLYFSGKDDLVLAWIARGDRQKLATLRSLHREAGKSATEHIAAALLARILTRFDNAQPYTESIDELLAALRARVLVQRDNHHEAEAAVIADLLREGIGRGELPALPDPLATARLLILGTNSLLPYSLSARQLGERAEVEARARGLINLLLGGLHASAMYSPFSEEK